jgi:thiamine-phosphate pyrophosphorylase
VIEALRAGLPAVLLREDDADWASDLAAAGFAPGRVIVHARVPGARTLCERQGWGLHLPDVDLPARIVALRPQVTGLLGASTHSVEAARAALAAGADYAFLSPIWRPGSKPDDTRLTLGPGVFGELRGLPVLALGGVTPEREREARAAGAWGGAGMGVFGAPDSGWMRNAER